jgi:hypothetical protein
LHGVSGFSRFYYCENGTGGSSHTFTVTPASSQFCAIYALEITGGALAAILDQSNENVDATSAYTSPSITTTQANEALISFLMCDASNGTAVFAESTGHTIQEQQNDQTNGWTGCLTSRLVTSTLTTNSSFTISGVTGFFDTSVFIASFKEAAAAAGHPAVKRMGGVRFAHSLGHGKW